MFILQYLSKFILIYLVDCYKINTIDFSIQLDVLKSEKELINFYNTSFGLELIIKLYVQSQYGIYMHNDKFHTLWSGKPRREVF